MFYGPRCQAGDRRRSKVLVTDYFGYNHWRSFDAFGSCEPLPKSNITAGTDVSGPYWSREKGNLTLQSLEVNPQAGYTDGRVAGFSPSQVITVNVPKDEYGYVPYLIKGDFYLPREDH